MALVADYRYVFDGKYYWSNIPWDQRFFDLYQGRLAKLVLFGMITRESVPPDHWHKISDNRVVVRGLAGSYYGLGVLRAIPSLCRALREVCSQCDILYIKLFYVSSVVAFLVNRWSARKPVVAQLVGDAPSALNRREDLIPFAPIRRLASKVVSGMTRHILSRATVASTVSHALREKFAAHRPDVVVANESWLEPWMFSSKAAEEHLVVRFLFVGRLVAAKGLRELMTAFEELVKQLPIQLGIVGDGPMRQEVQRWAEERVPKGSVNVFGYVESLSEQLFSIYRAHDVLILPSYAEGTPLVILEAMANSLAVIATNVGGIPEIVEDNVNGILIRPGDVLALREAMRRLACDPELCQAFSAQGYRKALAHTYQSQRGKLSAAILEMAVRKGLIHR